MNNVHCERQAISRRRLWEYSLGLLASSSMGGITRSSTLARMQNGLSAASSEKRSALGSFHFFAICCCATVRNGRTNSVDSSLDLLLLLLVPVPGEAKTRLPSPIFSPSSSRRVLLPFPHFPHPKEAKGRRMRDLFLLLITFLI